MTEPASGPCPGKTCRARFRSGRRPGRWLRRHRRMPPPGSGKPEDGGVMLGERAGDFDAVAGPFAQGLDADGLFSADNDRCAGLDQRAGARDERLVLALVAPGEDETAPEQAGGVTYFGRDIITGAGRARGIPAGSPARRPAPISAAASGNSRGMAALRKTRRSPSRGGSISPEAKGRNRVSIGAAHHSPSNKKRGA
jgi:hypothetical protein